MSMSYVRNIILMLAAVSSSLLMNGCSGCLLRGGPKTVGGFSSPESVVFDPGSGYFFVSNVGAKLEPSAKDSDGFVSKLSSKGSILALRYLPKSGVLHAPKGMAVIGRTLYVADVDRVVGFDTKTREQIFELDFSSEQTNFLNDLAVLDDNTLFVSATDIGKIYEISLGREPRFTHFVDNITGVNGLYVDRKGRRLFVVTFGEGFKANGKLGVISLGAGTPEYKTLTDEIGGLDGVALLTDSKVMFSDWVAFDKPGLMRVYNIDTGELSLLPLSTEVRGPADFFYDRKNHRLWLPKMLEGEVLIEKI